jgi:cytochrome P450
MRTLIIKLIENPEWQERIREEIFCERMVGEENTSQDMTYLKWFILESLRNQETCLRTKPRTLKNSIHFDGHYFPKGTVF